MSLREPNMMEWKKEEEVNINKTKHRILLYFLKRDK